MIAKVWIIFSMNNIRIIIAFICLIISVLIHQMLLKTNEIEYEIFEFKVIHNTPWINDLKTLKLR